MTDEQRREKLEELVKTEMPMVQIAAELGFGSYHTFRLWLSENGLEITRAVRDKFAGMRLVSAADREPAEVAA